MNLRLSALRPVVLKVLADEIAASVLAAKDTVKQGFTETGTTQTVPVLPDGTKVATVALAGDGKKSASVISPHALLAWAKANHPEEIVETVRDTYLKKLLDEAKAAGKPVDPATGEVVPGIVVGDSGTYVSVRLKPGGREAIVAAWRAGELRDIELVAAPGIGSAEGDAAA
jgi:hypothetical protein